MKMMSMLDKVLLSVAAEWELNSKEGEMNEVVNCGGVEKWG